MRALFQSFFPTRISRFILNFGPFTRAGYPVVFALVCLLSCTLFSVPLQAQPDLTITRTWTSWPRIVTHFKVLCGGVHRVDLKKENFRLYDNGDEVTDFTLQTPAPGGSPFSCMLLFDASGSMAGTYNEAAKTAGKCFISRMNGSTDEASLYWFTEQLERGSAMTTQKPWLKAAMDQLPASGATAIWDAVYQALDTLNRAAHNSCKSIILLTDGIDNSSLHTWEDIVDAANWRDIRINIVQLGSNSMYGQMVAQQTGGKNFVVMDTTQLTNAYLELFTDARFCSSECALTFDRQCADGSMFQVDLRLEHFCSGADVESFSLQAPLDAGTYRSLDFHLADAYVQGGNDLNLTVWLASPVDSTVFQPLSVPLVFDRTKIELQQVTAPPGTLLDGVPLTLTSRQDGALITTQVKRLIHGTGPFLELHFSTVSQHDTVQTDVTLGGMSFASGCLRSDPVTAQVSLFPPGPIPLVYCETQGMRTLQWDRMSENYAPNPFPVMTRFLNAGSADAKEARFALNYDSTILHLVQPLQDTIIYAFSDITPGSHAAVSWDLETPVRLHDVSTEVCITALFDNHPPVECCYQVEIPRADGILRCSLSAPEIKVDALDFRYEPMPFPLTAVISNIGGRPADDVNVYLVPPENMELAGPDAPDNFRKYLRRDPLPPGGTDTLVWMLQYPVVQRSITPTVHATAQSNSTGARSCDLEIPIPGIDQNDFHFLLIASGALAICPGDSVSLDAGGGRDAYEWNTGATTRRITVHDAGEYFCLVSSAQRRGSSDTVAVSMLTPPTPHVVSLTALPLCAGDTAVLDAGDGYLSYAWNTGDHSQRIEVTTEGYYQCEVIDSSGCRGMSDSLIVTMAPPPETPVIERFGDLLTSSVASHYEWYLDGNPLPDSDNQFHQTTATGTYRVRITDANGCEAWSEEFPVDVLSIEVLPAEVRAFDVYPNPASASINVQLQLVKEEPVELALTDALGRTLSRSIRKRARVLQVTLSGLELPSGIYLLHVRGTSFSMVRRIALRH
ncbi:T9SS type A sorting domain-containing protein [bacterium]|nr:T9SS type A sorting domain-containing protein [bacterium]